MAHDGDQRPPGPRPADDSPSSRFTNWADEVEDAYVDGTLSATPGYSRGNPAGAAPDRLGAGREPESKSAGSMRREAPQLSGPPYSIYLGNMPPDSCADDVYRLFPGAKIVSVRHAPTVERPFCFVDFLERQDAVYALSSTNLILAGRSLVTQVAERPPPPRPDVGGYYGGPVAAAGGMPYPGGPHARGPAPWQLPPGSYGAGYGHPAAGAGPWTAPPPPPRQSVPPGTAAAGGPPAASQLVPEGPGAAASDGPPSWAARHPVGATENGSAGVAAPGGPAVAQQHRARMDPFGGARSVDTSSLYWPGDRRAPQQLLQRGTLPGKDSGAEGAAFHPAAADSYGRDLDASAVPAQPLPPPPAAPPAGGALPSAAGEGAAAGADGAALALQGAWAVRHVAPTARQPGWMGLMPGRGPAGANARHLDGSSGLQLEPAAAAPTAAPAPPAASGSSSSAATGWDQVEALLRQQGHSSSPQQAAASPGRARDAGSSPGSDDGTLEAAADDSCVSQRGSSPALDAVEGGQEVPAGDASQQDGGSSSGDLGAERQYSSHGRGMGPRGRGLGRGRGRARGGAPRPAGAGMQYEQLAGEAPPPPPRGAGQPLDRRRGRGRGPRYGGAANQMWVPVTSGPPAGSRPSDAVSKEAVDARQAAAAHAAADAALAAAQALTVASSTEVPAAAAAAPQGQGQGRSRPASGSSNAASSSAAPAAATRAALGSSAAAPTDGSSGGPTQPLSSTAEQGQQSWGGQPESSDVPRSRGRDGGRGSRSSRGRGAGAPRGAAAAAAAGSRRPLPPRRAGGQQSGAEPAADAAEELQAGAEQGPLAPVEGEPPAAGAGAQRGGYGRSGPGRGRGLGRGRGGRGRGGRGGRGEGGQGGDPEAAGNGDFALSEGAHAQAGQQQQQHTKQYSRPPRAPISEQDVPPKSHTQRDALDRPPRKAPVRGPPAAAAAGGGGTGQAADSQGPQPPAARQARAKPGARGQDAAANSKAAAAAGGDHLESRGGSRAGALPSSASAAAAAPAKAAAKGSAKPPTPGQKLFKEITESRKQAVARSTHLSNVYEVLLEAGDD